MSAKSKERESKNEKKRVLEREVNALKIKNVVIWSILVEYLVAIVETSRLSCM